MVYQIIMKSILIKIKTKLSAFNIICNRKKILEQIIVNVNRLERKHLKQRNSLNTKITGM